VLSSEASAEPGRWRTDRAPWLREILDSLSDPTVERVVYMKPAQCGGTEAANNFVGYFMDQDPSPVLVLQPTVDLGKLWSKERLDPMLRDTPQLRGRVREGNRREKDQSILRKVFPGGYLAIVGANSAAGLRARPVRAILADEVDAYPQSAKGSARKDAKLGATGEGDPLSLAIKRTTTFWNRKIYECSTPTVDGFSRIQRDYAASSRGRWLVPCPRCGYVQELRWRNIQWLPGKPATAVHLCGEISADGELTAGCGEPILEHQKLGMNQRGGWRHEAPDERRVRGFWHNALCSSFVTWRELAQEFEESKGNAEEMKVFVNTRLAECWRDDAERVNESMLASRRRAYPAEVPMGGAVLTAAVDVQGDRLEYAVIAWGTGEESWRIKHEKLWGDPAQAEVWRQLDLALFRPWQHESGETLGIRCVAVDSGGHHTEQVYRYARAHRSKGVWAIKGIGEPGRAAVVPPARKSKHRLWTLGTIALKDILFARLKQEKEGPGYMHFGTQTTNDYIEQLGGERRITAYVRGRPSHRYVEVPGKRNEALDLECYALAALYMLGPVRDHLDREATKLGERAAIRRDPPRPSESPAESPAIVRPSPRPRGGWVNRWRQ
jgi:phage terminase large subunit GpA-like protein